MADLSPLEERLPDKLGAEQPVFEQPVLEPPHIDLDLPFASKKVRSSRLFDWNAGASAQFEIVAVPGDRVLYKVNCATPWRSAIRPPMEDSRITSETLEVLQGHFAKVDHVLNANGAGRSTAREMINESEPTSEDLIRLGINLYSRIIPRDDQQAFKEHEELFLEIGVDEKLNDYPLELMHDGSEYFCLKHFVGRYVVSPKAREVRRRSPPEGLGIDRPSVLLVLKEA